MIPTRTQPGPGYIEPDREEIKQAAAKVGLKRWAPATVRDLSNLASGGRLRPLDEILDEATKDLRVTRIDTEANSFPRFQATVGTRTAQGGSREAAEANLRESLEKSERAYRGFLEAQAPVVRSTPGTSSPLAKAVGFLKVLAAQKGEAAGGDGESLPVFTEEQAAAAAKDVKSLLDQVDSLDDLEKDLLEEDEKEEDDGDDALGTIERATRLAGKKAKALEVARNLKTLTRMRVSKRKEAEKDPEGSDTRRRPMESLGELSRVSAVERALPKSYRMYRAVTRQPLIRERITTVEKKQLIYLVVDCSGSMNEGDRAACAAGVVMNRLRCLLEDTAEVYLAFFDNKLREGRKVEREEAAQVLREGFLQGNFSGGSTSIDSAVREAHRRCEELVVSGQELTRPEVVVVTDGDDTVTVRSSDIPGTKVHGFVVGGGDNIRLRELAVATGGVGVCM